MSNLYVTKIYYIVMLSLTFVSFPVLIFFERKNLTPKQVTLSHKITKFLLLLFLVCNVQILIDEILAFVLGILSQ